MCVGKSKSLYVAFLILLWGIIFLRGQQLVPTVTFEQTFPGSDPGHYIISIASDCRATYQSNGKLTEEAAAEDTSGFEFTVTPPNCARVFDLTKRARYFERELDSKRKNLASTGIKTLSYKDSQKSTKGTYNYSLLPEVQQLTAVFQALGGTLEFGRRLEYHHHYQKLALDEDFKRMEEWSAGNGLQEISAISPTLQKIVDDPSLMKVVRVRAQQMLVMASK